MNGAKTLAAACGKPVAAVHHMEAHLLTARLTAPPGTLAFPYLCLLASGGHTLIILARGCGARLRSHCSFRN